MKARRFITASTVLCTSVLVLATCRAADETNKAASTPKTSVVSPTSAGQTTKPQKLDASVAKQSKPTVLTGSYIPDKVKRDGRITEGMFDVTVIDQDEIEHSGAATLAQVLAREPGITFRHR